MLTLKSVALMTVGAVMLGAAPLAGQEVGPRVAHALLEAVGTQLSPGIQPYVFAAPGGVSNGGTTLQLGGGVDVLLWKGLGASIEGGYLGPVEAMDDGIGIISANAFYQFGTPTRRRVTPFVTGGYTLGFRSQAVNAMNIGGGANYWISETLGLRFELRDHLPVLGGGVRDEHLWGVRMGLTWRR
jgi:hypothetical protein